MKTVTIQPGLSLKSTTTSSQVPEAVEVLPVEPLSSGYRILFTEVGMGDRLKDRVDLIQQCGAFAPDKMQMGGAVEDDLASVLIAYPPWPRLAHAVAPIASRRPARYRVESRSALPGAARSVGPDRSPRLG